MADANEAVFAEVFSTHRGAAVSGAMRSGRSEGVDDVVQEVFERLWTRTRPDRFDPGRGSLQAFLYQDAVGRSIDAGRSDTSRRRREDRDVRTLTDELADPVAGAWEAGDDASLVRRALIQLPDTERAPIELAYYGELTYAQVATQLQQPEGTIKSRIRRGLRRMATTLRADGFGPGGSDR
ncbi:MAG: sigma-70 family RNA polymerase sigma factor [Acidimicrobiales bacterium]|nr:sigma-70 family RNA polymerase sigma factor [Acidimicrobiales bacterium]